MQIIYFFCAFVFEMKILSYSIIESMHLNLLKRPWR